MPWGSLPIPSRNKSTSSPKIIAAPNFHLSSFFLTQKPETKLILLGITNYNFMAFPVYLEILIVGKTPVFLRFLKELYLVVFANYKH